MVKIGIKRIRGYLPERRVDNVEKGKSLQADEAFVRNKIGMTALARISEKDESSDLAVYAVLELVKHDGLQLENVEALFMVTQNPDGNGLPHCSAILHQKLDLPINCSVLDISLGCSGYVHGLIVAKAFMESQGLTNGLVVTADPYSKIVDADDRDTALLFGDGASATWLSDNYEWGIGCADFGTISDQRDALKVLPSGELSMNGRAIFNFAATYVPPSLRKILEQSDLDISDVDLVVLHQGSKYIIDTLNKRIGAGGKAKFYAADYGNTVSSSIPMILSSQIPEEAHRILISGFGVGLAWASCILEKPKSA